MEIKHDRSYISPADMEFVERGYGHEYVRNFRFYYVYTEEEQYANLAFAKKVGGDSPEWRASCVEAAQRRSNHMLQVMEAIGAKHWCYQFNKDHDMKLFKSDNWDLFFWCNDFYSTIRSSDLSGRDYSYFTLNFNDSQSAEKQKEVYESVMQILSQFQDDEHIEVAVQYDIALDEAKIKEDADRVSSSLIGKRTTYSPTSGLVLFPGFEMEGRIVEANGSLFFMKKRARNKGYLLSKADILRIYWALAS